MQQGGSDDKGATDKAAHGATNQGMHDAANTAIHDATNKGMHRRDEAAWRKDSQNPSGWRRGRQDASAGGGAAQMPHHARPFERCPRSVLGAVDPFLELLGGAFIAKV